MPGLKLALLGPFHGQLQGDSLGAFRTKSVQALLLFLAMEVGRGPVRREALVEMIWPGLPPESGRKNLRQSLYELRKMIPAVPNRTEGQLTPFLLADRQTIQINEVCDVQVDALTFESLAKKEDEESLKAAVTLYRGDFLSDFYLPDSGNFEGWVASRRAQLRRQVLVSLEKLAAFSLERGDYREAQEYAWRQLEIDELREKGLAQLMLALAGDGQRSAALEQYEEGRLRLRKELEAEPSAETTAVYESILADEAPAEWVTPLVLDVVDGGDTISHNLPSEPTPFVGREKELSELDRLLHSPDCRLLTLLGPGGSGKTRLAIRLGYQLKEAADPFIADGIWFISLAQAPDVETFISSLASVTGYDSFDLQAPLNEQLNAYLGRRKMLFILDNFEYMVDPEGRQLLVEIMTHAPGIKFLVCSRSRLNAQAEQLYPVSGLEVPEEGAVARESEPLAVARHYTAVQLFENSARRVRAGFSLAEKDLESVLAICRRLEGMPLGIELAATWVELLSPVEIATELNQNLDFLQAEWVDIPDRQRSLRAVFETSWKLLDDEERLAVQRLSNFHGGFSREAARQVAGADLRMLLGLVNKSWLQREKMGRFRAHEMLRQYAFEMLSADALALEDVEELQATYFAGFVAEQGERLKGSQQREAGAMMAADMENITAAWRWFVDKGELNVLTERMLPGLFLYCSLGARGQLIVTLADMAYQALRSDEDDPAPEIILLTARASFQLNVLIVRYLISEFVPLSRIEDIKNASDLAHKFGLNNQMGFWSVLLANLVSRAIDRDRGIQWLRSLVEEHRHLNDPWLLGFTLEFLGDLLLPTGHGRPEGRSGMEEANRFLEEAREIFEELGDELEIGHTLRLLGLLRRDSDRLQAKEFLLSARQALDSVGDRVMAANVGIQLGEVCIYLGEIDEAFRHYQEMRDYYADMGNRQFEAYAYSKESLEALRYSSLEHARRMREQSLALSEVEGDVHGIAWSTWELGDIERVAGNLDLAQELFERSWNLFEKANDPSGFIFCQRGLGDVAQARSEFGKAEILFIDSLRLARQHSHLWVADYALSGIGRAYLGMGKMDLARDHFLEAFRLGFDSGFNELVMIALVGLADVSARRGQPEKALRWCGFVLSQHASWNETRGQAKDIREAVLPILDSTTIEAAQRWAEEATLKLVEEEISSLDSEALT